MSLPTAKPRHLQKERKESSFCNLFRSCRSIGISLPESEGGSALREKRVISIFFMLLVMFVALMLRLFWLTQTDNTYRQTDSQHGSYAIKVNTVRGTIYDRNLKQLVNTGISYYAVVAPTKENAAGILSGLRGHVSDFASLQTRIGDGLPFVVRVDTLHLKITGVRVFSTVDRYGAGTLAPHIVGYLSGDGSGASGIEKAYDAQLKKYSQTITASVAVNAMGQSLRGLEADVQAQGSDPAGGVELTLDSSIQAIAQQAANRYIAQGAVVVMDVKTGEILASVSNPSFSQSNLAQALKSGGSPLLNRALSAYNLGSVFKIAVTAAALQAGVSEGFSYTCTGSLDVAGRIFHCHLLSGHGTENMEEGFANSCNPYYITLGQQVGGDKIISMAQTLGFGAATELAPGYRSDAGLLPAASQLQVPAALANFSMGEGTLMSTPVQVARMICAVANGGLLPTPKLVRGTVNAKLQLTKTASAAPDRVFSQEIADKIKQFMIYTVEAGTGKPAKPEYGGAGGKTATAETGWVMDGKTINQAWFAGFYPAASPRYAIVAMLENGVAGGTDVGPVFKYIADRLAPSLGLVPSYSTSSSSTSSSSAGGSAGAAASSALSSASSASAASASAASADSSSSATDSPSSSSGSTAAQGP